MKIRAITVAHPWAAWIIEGRKTVIVKPYHSRHRGEILICSAPQLDLSACVPDDWSRSLKYGRAIACACVVDCRPFEEKDVADSFMAWRPGQFAYQLRDVEGIKAFSVPNLLGIFEVDE